MTRPNEFQEGYIAIQNVPYLRESPQDLGSGGVLAKGQLVWLQTMFDAEEQPISISAFVDGIGIISVDPRLLAVANPGVSILMDRVARLEKLVCHLLRRNEELRMALREASAVDRDNATLSGDNSSGRLPAAFAE
jgi:hypothetical protein